jgi:hypothetical protein
MAATGNEYFARHLPARMGHATANRRLHDNDKDQEHFKGKWASFARLITCCAPSFLLSRMGGMHDRNVQQAWREKIVSVEPIIKCYNDV